MRKSLSLRTVKNATIRPFGFFDEVPWARLQYRFDSAEAWRSVLERPMVVLPNAYQDVRRDAIHSFRVAIDLDVLRRAGLDPDVAEVILLIRDNFAKRVHVVYKNLVRQNEEFNWDVPLSICEQLSGERRVEFEFILASRTKIELYGASVKPYGRLARHIVAVSTETHGVSFNFVRTTAQEFEAMGLPGRTTWHLMIKNPRDLIEECEDVSEVLRVLVHDDAWIVLQEIRAGDATGEAIGSLLTSELIGAILAIAGNIADLKRDEIVLGSVVDRVLSWLAGPNGNVDQLAEMLVDEGGFHDIGARAHDAIRLTRSLRRLHLDGGADE